MKHKIAQELIEEAEKLALTMSDRKGRNEEFRLDKITPLSDQTAAVVYEKEGGKFGLAFFYYVKCKGYGWMHFWPTDSHLLGMTLISQAKQKIETANWGAN